jgi:integrase
VPGETGTPDLDDTLPVPVTDRADGAAPFPNPAAQRPAATDDDKLSALSAATIADQLHSLAGRAARYAAQARGAGTRQAYGSAWRAYANWCADIGSAPLSGDPSLVALYLTKRAGDRLAVSSLKVARAAIVAAHRHAAVSFDTTDRRLTMVMEGIVRDQASAGTRQAAPVVPDLLRRLLVALPSPNTPAAAAALAARHLAILLIGFGAALRGSEIVALTIRDVATGTRGLTVLVRRSKTDQHGKGKRIAIWANHRHPDFCPVAAFEAWMGFRKQGLDLAAEPPAPAAAQPLFCGVTLGRSHYRRADGGQDRRPTHQAGLPGSRARPDPVLRALVAARSAHHSGALQLPLVDVMRQSRHKSVETALGYIEDGDAAQQYNGAGVRAHTVGVNADAGDGRERAGDVVRFGFLQCVAEQGIAMPFYDQVVAAKASYVGRNW